MEHNLASNTTILTSILKPVPHQKLLASQNTAECLAGLSSMTKMERDASKIVVKNEFFGKDDKIEMLMNEIEGQEKQNN